MIRDDIEVNAILPEYIARDVRKWYHFPDGRTLEKVIEEAIKLAVTDFEKRQEESQEQCSDCGEVILGAHGHCPAANDIGGES